MANWVGRVAGLALFITVGAAAADDRVVGVAERVRIASGVSGHIHPSLCLSKKGTLVASYGRVEYKDLRITRSTDGGKTWSPSAPFPPTANVDYYPGSLTTLGDGRIVHAWNTWYGEGKRKSRFVQFAISDDDGLTWGPTKSLPKNPDKESVIRHPIVERAPGQWLLPLMDKTVVYDPATEAITPFGDGRNHGLVPIVRSTKGTFVSGAGLRSTDGGKTWAKVEPFPKIAEQGWRHEMLALSNGWLIASDIEGPGFGGETIRFIVSRDDGLTWDFKNPVVYYHPGRPIGGRACPKTVALDAQTLGTIFYDIDAQQEGGPGVFFLRTPVTRLPST